ncbi:MAG: helix-turn-helix domain-containing protein, partial [Methylophilaceae bacterium]
MSKSGIQAVTGARSIQQAKRRAEIMQLRVEGLTLRQIADQIGVDVAVVHGIISRALTAITKEPTEELLALELNRCDLLLTAAMQTVKAFHPLIHAGRVVSAPMLNEQGEPVRNPQTGDVLTRVVEDKAPKLAA